MRIPAAKSNFEWLINQDLRKEEVQIAPPSTGNSGVKGPENLYMNSSGNQKEKKAAKSVTSSCKPSLEENKQEATMAAKGV